MSEPIEIGLRQIYDKLCGLEDRVSQWRLEDQMSFVRLESRIEALEQARNKGWTLVGPWIASVTAIIVMVVTLLAKG